MFLAGEIFLNIKMNNLLCFVQVHGSKHQNCDLINFLPVHSSEYHISNVLFLSSYVSEYQISKLLYLCHF